MKFRGSNTKAKDIRLHMTAMIDIVFQLLVFFIMTFKVVAMEADFNVRMPLATDVENPVDEVIPTRIEVRLNAGGEGKIASISVDNGIDAENLDDVNMYQNLTEFVEKTVSNEGDPSSSEETEVEFDIDYNLKYSYTIRAIESVSGRILPDGTVKKLVEKIKFRDNSGSQ